MLKESSFVKKISSTTLQCTLCPTACKIAEGGVGKCKTRGVEKGKLVDFTYGNFAAVALDPVEKKPLSHFLPGTQTLSVGTRGCNMVCPFCQNSSLAQIEVFDRETKEEFISPSTLVEMAMQNGCDSISFTYSEPVLSLEYAIEVFDKAKKEGIKMVFVSNGQINEEPLKELCTIVDGANIDLKSFSEKTYKTILKGDLSAALNAIEALHKSGVWVEVTTLVVPTLNDSETELRQIAKFIAGVSRDIPWHISRFHPSYKWDSHEATPVETIKMACKIAKEEGLNYVYTGNVSQFTKDKTVCPNCETIVIDRDGYRLNSINTQNSRCIKCNHSIPGVGLN